jgi:NAD(P)-dependent dehydrogenase (short-subunit alcohol dehydrogenase family)
LSSGAARQGSPLSGGYAGAKATVGFVSEYAGAESRRAGLGIRFVALLPKLTPATRLGATFVDSYADLEQVDRELFRASLGESLTPEQVADAVVHVAGHSSKAAPAYLLTGAGLTPLE